MLRFYVEVARTAYRRQLIYRWANLAGLCTNVFFCIVLSSVLIALYHARPTVGSYNLRDALSYSWATQAMIMVVLPFGWVDLMLTIRTGEVVTDLSKPCDFFCYWCSRELGRAVYFLIFRGLPTYLAGLLIFQVELGAGWSIWPVFLLSLTLGTVTGVVFRILMNLAAFWMIEARSIVVFGLTIAQFFAGAFLPLVFFPAWLATLAAWLPFSGMMNGPAMVFLGKLGGPSLLREMLLQLAWLLVLTVLVRLLTKIATRRVVVQGG
jgi:ABC-2 type transport system permease protein